MFGTTAGKVIVMSASGAMVAQVIIHEGLEINYLGWSSERFHLVEQESNEIVTSGDLGSSSKQRLSISHYVFHQRLTRHLIQR